MQVVEGGGTVPGSTREGCRTPAGGVASMTTSRRRARSVVTVTMALKEERKVAAATASPAATARAGT
ncbi:hypothetical protein GUJ93_ZPchr0009g1340 [Zizania palustris]|uniref:Uncharacterized protein n=1 Tax=Zizania palustris TaxID=103762 RepID=A0A8J5UXI8_ZIZPA|nr:hypothetical protein GUJ93_ZPchr0009g1340 [Zizania palustris]